MQIVIDAVYLTQADHKTGRRVAVEGCRPKHRLIRCITCKWAALWWK